jgi:hypothetical protein
MLKFKITSKDQNHKSEYFGEASMIEQIVAWLEPEIYGLPERWVPHKDEGGEYDEADVLDERIVELSPAQPLIPEQPAVYEGGSLVSEAVPMIPEVPAVTQKQVKLRAEYSVQIEDISQQLEQERINAEALAFLLSTDWLVIRELDAGIPCPAEVKAARQAAREKIVK